MEGQASFQTVPALAAVSGWRPRPQVPSGCLTRRWATPGLTLGQEPRRIFSPAEAAASGPKERSDRLKTLNAPCAPLRLPTFSSTCRPAVRHSSHARLPLPCDTLGHWPLGGRTWSDHVPLAGRLTLHSFSRRHCAKGRERSHLRSEARRVAASSPLMTDVEPRTTGRAASWGLAQKRPQSPDSWRQSALWWPRVALPQENQERSPPPSTSWARAPQGDVPGF